MPEDLWRGTRNLIHVLDEEFDPHRPIDIDSIDFSADRAELRSPFHIGDTVTHSVFGDGVITAANKEWTTFEVEFGDGRTRSIRAAFLKLADLPE